MLKKVTAEPFRKRRTDSLKKTQYIYCLSSELNWYTPKQSKGLLEKSLDEGILSINDDVLHINFSREKTGSIDSPPKYEEIVRDRTVTEQIISELESAGYTKKDVVSEINAAVQEMQQVDIDAAAILVAEKKGLDTDEYVDSALNELVKD
ncbi:MAG: DUF2240 family protein [Halobacteria archaeon]